MLSTCSLLGRLSSGQMGFFCISVISSFSFLAKVATEEDLWASAKVKQLHKEMALEHLCIDASSMRGEMSSTVM